MSNINDFIIENGVLKKYTGKGKKAVIPDEVIKIDNYAFFDCDRLTEIIIPKNVYSIGNNAFYGCKNLTEIIIPESVTSIGISAFEGCTGLTSFTIPESVKEVFGKLFDGCVNLKQINISGTGEIVFAETPGLNEILIAVEDVLFDRKPENIALSPDRISECRRLLDTIGKGRNLHAIWTTMDKDTEQKLEKSGLKSYFMNCLVCDSFERDFGRKVMSRDYYFNTIEKAFKLIYPNIPYPYIKNYDAVLFISDYEGSYKKGCFYETVYYDPNKIIGWELPSGCTAHNYDEIIKAVDYYDRQAKSENASCLVKFEFDSIQYRETVKARVAYLEKHFAINKWNKAIENYTFPEFEAVTGTQSKENVIKKSGEFEIEINKDSLLTALHDLWKNITKYGLIDVSNGTYEYKLIKNIFQQSMGDVKHLENGIDSFVKAWLPNYFNQVFPEGADAYKNLGMIDILSPEAVVNIFTEFAVTALNPSDEKITEIIDAFPKKKNGTFMKNKRLSNICTLTGVVDEIHETPKPEYGKYYIAKVYSLTAKSIDDNKLVFEIQCAGQVSSIMD